MAQPTPSRGYQALAELIKDRYFDLILTLNFDELLETALEAAGVHNVKRVAPERRQDDLAGARPRRSGRCGRAVSLARAGGGRRRAGK